MRGFLTYILGGAALVLNPFFACDQTPAYQYGLPEIEAAIAGTWQATDDGTGRSVKFRIEAGSATQQQSSRGLVRSAAACGSRTLVKSAHACMDSTEVPLVLVALDDNTKTWTGKLTVPGTYFDVAILELRLGDKLVSASINPNGDVRGSDGAKLAHTK